MSVVKHFLLIAAAGLMPVFLKAQLPCLPVSGFNNGGFETFTTSPGNCTFDNNGFMTAPFNAGCVSGWIGANGSPNLISGITGGLTPVSPPPGSTVFAGMAVKISGGTCNNEIIAANVAFDFTAVYELTFKHRKAVNSSSTSGPAGFTGQVIIGAGYPNHPGATSIEDCIVFSSKERIVFSSSGISSSEWVTETVVFSPMPGHNQILFAPVSPVSQNTTYWLVDDIVLRKCQPCKAKFTVLNCTGNNYCAYSFLNQSTAGSGATITGFTWTITALDDPEQPVITSTDKNFIFLPPCNGRYRVCLTVKDSKGCTNEYCEIITVTCSACRCVPGPNPCEAIPDPIDTIRRAITAAPVMDVPQAMIKIAPNPARNSFTVQLQNGVNEAPVLIQVVDAAGRVVLNRREPVQAGRAYSLQAGNFKAGVYLVRITQNGQLLHTEKLVVTG